MNNISNVKVHFKTRSGNVNIKERTTKHRTITDSNNGINNKQQINNNIRHQQEVNKKMWMTNLPGL